MFKEKIWYMFKEKIWYMFKEKICTRYSGICSICTRKVICALAGILIPASA